MGYFLFQHLLAEITKSVIAAKQVWAKPLIGCRKCFSTNQRALKGTQHKFMLKYCLQGRAKYLQLMSSVNAKVIIFSKAPTYASPRTTTTTATFDRETKINIQNERKSRQQLIHHHFPELKTAIHQLLIGNICGKKNETCQGRT